MFKFHIQGKKDGIYEIDMASDASLIQGIFPEFFGVVELKGKLRIIGKRFTLDAIAKCQAKFICDLSLEEYTEIISVELITTYLANQEIYRELLKLDDDFINENGETIISEEVHSIDFAPLLAQELSVNLPLKRVSPKYKDLELEQIYPEHIIGRSDSVNLQIDDRWSELKKLKIN